MSPRPRSSIKTCSPYSLRLLYAKTKYAVSLQAGRASCGRSSKLERNDCSCLMCLDSYSIVSYSIVCAGMFWLLFLFPLVARVGFRGKRSVLQGKHGSDSLQTWPDTSIEALGSDICSGASYVRSSCPSAMCKCRKAVGNGDPNAECARQRKPNRLRRRYYALERVRY